MLPTVMRCMALAALIGLSACQSSGRNAPISLESRLRLAQASAGPGDGRAQLAILREAATQRPNDVSVLGQLSSAAERAGEYAEAAEAQRALMARQGRSEARLSSIGLLLLRAGDAEGAARAFEEALAMAPRSLTAARGLGLSRDMMGDREGAQRAYRAGLAVYPTDWTLRSNLGMSQIASGGAREAIAVLSDAEILANAPTHARHNLALAYAAAGDPLRATRVLRIDMGPAEAQAMTDEMVAFSEWLNSSLPRPATLEGLGAAPVAARRR